MPRYTYRCIRCKREQEVQHLMRKKYKAPCQCGGRMVKLMPRSVIGTRNANQTLLDDMNDKFNMYRYRRKKGLVR